MAEEKKTLTLTEQQQAVVDNRGGNLLVAAAAGSGKTKVLVDRIMSRVCDEKHDITEFVVITFTRAAAAELRAKITAELSRRLADEPGNAHIRKQLQLVYAANISTVHSFCGNLLRNYAAVIGLPSDFKVAEEQESRVLRSAAMAELIESVYNTIDSRPDVKAFIDEMGFGRDDKAAQAILFRVYDTVQSHPWPAQWMKQCLASMSAVGYSDAAETPWGAYIVNDTKKYIASQIHLVTLAEKLCYQEEPLAVALSGALAADRARMEEMLRCETWDQLSAAAGAGAWGRAKAVKKGVAFSELLKEQIGDIRERYKKGIASKLKHMSQDSTTVLADLALTTASVRGLFEMMSAFEDKYRAKKELNNMLDFSDLEHETIRLLLNEETGERTEIAEALSKQYVEIMVDEYQDTNEVQETIFSALSNGCNLSMVGDVKQSIYSFRLADPSIFQRHYNVMDDYTGAEDGEGRKILLTRNFRSRPEILSATNDVMRLCMSNELGGVDYSDAEALQPGRTDFAPMSEPVVELVGINMDAVASAETEPGEEDTEIIAKSDVEAKYVAKRIKEMLSSTYIMDEATGETRLVKASDVAILLRSTKNPAKHYVKALAEQGIASTSSRSGSIMETTEIATLYAYLQIIDNPTQDIPLVAVLASPLVGFTADKLAKVRVAKKDATNFYEALHEYIAQNPKDRDAADFMKQFTSLRATAHHMKLSRLFSKVLEATDAEDVFGSMSNGTLRMANIHKFCEMISSYEAGGTRGLFEFICHIEALREQGAEMPQATAIETEDAVRIMSVHSSKGLEFPVVFLADMSRRFNRGDLKDSALLHKDLGIGVQVVDKERSCRWPTIARDAISMASDLEAKSEELRILYVAMTRAKQKLVMTYCDKLGRATKRLAGMASDPLPASVSQAANNPGEWVLLTAMTRQEGAPLSIMGGKLPSELKESAMPWSVSVVDACDVGGKHRTMEELEAMSEDDEVVVEADMEILYDIPEEWGEGGIKIQEAVDFRYPYEKSTQCKAKYTASALHNNKVTVKINRPNFAKRTGDFTAAERGTATHAFMRYANYARCVSEGRPGIAAEIARMVEKKFITELDAQAILVDALEALFSSEAGKDIAMLPPGTVKKEFPFSLYVPANSVPMLKDSETAIDDKVVVEGIIDLHAVTAEGVLLFDFKTDYVESEAHEEEKAEAYRCQMDVYTMALETIYKKPVIRREIIFLRTGHKVSV